MFKEISPKDIEGNLIKTIADEWMLITAGERGSYNTMTASWGYMGELWGSDSVAVFVRPQRYTLGFLEKNDFFTLSFYGDNKEIHKVCGSMSGRDADKPALCGLTPVFDEEAPYFEQARLVLVCKKQYTDVLKAENFTDQKPLERWYNDDLHRIFVGKIEKVLVKE